MINKFYNNFGFDVNYHSKIIITFLIVLYIICIDVSENTQK